MTSDSVPDAGFMSLYKMKPEKIEPHAENTTQSQPMFVDESVLQTSMCHPFPYEHVVIDNFFAQDKVNTILEHINQLKDEDASTSFVDPDSPYEFNKYAFSTR